MDQTFPARKYTKIYNHGISLITIACAFAISRAMVNSGGGYHWHGIIDMSDDYSPHVLLAVLFIITNLFTELITNNAAATLAFPLALSFIQSVWGKVDAFCCHFIAASASFPLLSVIRLI